MFESQSSKAVYLGLEDRFQRLCGYLWGSDDDSPVVILRAILSDNPSSNPADFKIIVLQRAVDSTPIHRIQT